MAWWDEDQPGVQPNFDYGSALASFLGQLTAGAQPSGQAGPGNWFDQFPGAGPAPSGQAGPGNWFDTFPGVGSSGVLGPGNWFDTFPGAGPAAPEPAFQGLGGYPGLEGLYTSAYNPPKVDLSALLGMGGAAAATPKVDISRLGPPFGTAGGGQPAGRQSGYGGAYGAPQGQQTPAQQRQQGYGGQATPAVGGPRASVAQGYQPYTAGQTGQQTGTSGGATAAGAAGGQFAAPLDPGGVYGQQKWTGGNGIDIFTRRGSPVYAIMDGTVSPSSSGMSPMGPVPTFLLRGAGGLSAQYAHAQLTAQGQVRKGQVIGYVGDPSMDMLGQYQGMPDGFQHLDLTIGHGGPFPLTGGDLNAGQFLQSIGYGRPTVGQTRGPQGGGGGMGMGMGQGGTPFGGMGGSPFGNPMQMLQGLFGGR